MSNALESEVHRLDTELVTVRGQMNKLKKENQALLKLLEDRDALINIRASLLYGSHYTASEFKRMIAVLDNLVDFTNT